LDACFAVRVCSFSTPGSLSMGSFVSLIHSCFYFDIWCSFYNHNFFIYPIFSFFPPLKQVFTFGSVPLKTYLPDGDIDLTAFSNNQNLKDSWANQVRDMLENEEKNEHAEFRVKEVQYIQAEVCPMCNDSSWFLFYGYFSP
jgi:hypothetical protein